MPAWLRRMRIEWEDWVRYSTPTRNLLSQMQGGRLAIRRAPGSSQEIVRRIRDLATVARITRRPSVVQEVLARVHALLPKLRSEEIDWTEFVPTAADGRLHTATVLKPWISPQEKGVLFLSFEREWVKLLHRASTRALADRYTIVVAPSSSPHNVINYVFPALFPEPVFSLISHEDETEQLPRISGNFRVVPLYASSWVLPSLFRPRPWNERDIPLIMIANFAKWKRHFALFAALRDMSPQLRVTLVGQEQDGRTAAMVRAQAADYGVADRINLIEDLPYPEIPQILSRARASVVLSRREGSCVVVAESLFAGTPAAVLHDAEIGSRAFLNEQTGCLLQANRLSRQLAGLVDRAGHYRPREWAEKHISCFASTQVLNAALKREALARGQAWTQDIAPMYWCPNPRVVHDDDFARLLPVHADLQQRFGLGIGPENEARQRLGSS
ncbi:MAG: glycosyltransferase [Gemmataceae bacterium]